MPPLLPNQAVEMSNIPFLASGNLPTFTGFMLWALLIMIGDQKLTLIGSRRRAYMPFWSSQLSRYITIHIFKALLHNAKQILLEAMLPHTLIMLKLLQLRKSSHIFNV